METTSPLYIVHHIPKTGGVSISHWLAEKLGWHKGFLHYGVAGELFCMQQKLPFLEEMSPEKLREIQVIMGHYANEATAGFFPGREVRRLITLREPSNRLISQYNHAMGFWCNDLGRPQMDFYEWFDKNSVKGYDYQHVMRQQGLTPEIAFRSQASLGPNYMGRFISYSFGKKTWPSMDDEAFAANVNELLETFWLVGMTEQMQMLPNALAQELGISAHIAHHNRGDQRKIYLKPTSDIISFIRENNKADFLIYDYWKSYSIGC